MRRSMGCSFGSLPRRAARATAWRTTLVVAALLVASGCHDAGDGFSAVVEARRVVVSSETAGRVLEVLVREGQSVSAGDALVRIDCEVPEAQQRAAEAQLEAARSAAAQASAGVELLDAGARTQEIAAAEAELRAAESMLRAGRAGATDDQRDQLAAALRATQARVALAEDSAARAEALEAAGAATQATLEAARAELEVARAEEQRARAALASAASGARSEDIDVLRNRVAQASARLDALREGARQPERDAAAAAAEGAQAGVRAAEASVALAAAAVARCTVAAPVGGTVDIVAVDAGELAAPGSPLVAIGAAGPVEVRTWATQDTLGTLKAGDRVSVALEATGVGTLEAVVARISDQAEFTGGNVQTPHDRALQVYRVDLVIDSPPPGVRPGMTGTVSFASDAR